MRGAKAGTKLRIFKDVIERNLPTSTKWVELIRIHRAASMDTHGIVAKQVGTMPGKSNGLVNGFISWSMGIPW
jgi:hypothetical protein